jgi:hypothetical protein
MAEFSVKSPPIWSGCQETFYAYMDQLDVLTSLSIGSEVAMLFVMFTYLVTIRASAALIVERVRLRVSG